MILTDVAHSALVFEVCHVQCTRTYGESVSFFARIKTHNTSVTRVHHQEVVLSAFFTCEVLNIYRPEMSTLQEYEQYDTLAVGKLRRERKRLRHLQRHNKDRAVVKSAPWKVRSRRGRRM